MQGVIALDKSLHILIEYPLGELAVLTHGTHIRKVSHLDYDLVEQLFLLGQTNLFVIIGYTSICAFLLGIVLFKCFVKELVIGLFQRYVAIGHIQMRSAFVHVFRDKAAIIVGKASFSESYTYCSVYTFTSVLSARCGYFFASETSDLFLFCSIRAKPVIQQQSAAKQYIGLPIRPEALA